VLDLGPESKPEFGKNSIRSKAKVGDEVAGRKHIVSALLIDSDA